MAAITHDEVGTCSSTQLVMIGLQARAFVRGVKCSGCLRQLAECYYKSLRGISLAAAPAALPHVFRYYFA